MAHPKRDYTIPVIVTANPKDWYVFFRFWHKAAWHEVKKREGINRIKDRKEKEAAIEALRIAREQWLDMGWNPMLDPRFEARPTVSRHDYGDLKKMRIADALEFALDKKKVSTKSRYDYQTTVRYISQAVGQCRLSHLPISALNRSHVKALMEEARNFTGKITVLKDGKQKSYIKRNPWSDYGYNKNLDFFSGLLSELVEWEALEFNPAFRINRLDVPETQKFVTVSDEEKDIIREYLFRKNYNFFIFVITIYHTGMRPKEILGLQMKDVNLKEQLIWIRPYDEKAKIKKERNVTINPHLLKFYKDMELHKYSPDHFVFSEGFRPGVIRIDRRVATNLWNDLVRGHLGIDKFMYSMKHRGADDLADALTKKHIKQDSIEDIIQDNLGHSKKFMTRRYTKKGILISQGIIKRNAPKF